MATTLSEYADDMRLAAAAASGSIPAWHEVVSRYSGAIVSVARSYLRAFEEDDWHNAYVDTLQYLYATGLARYDGSSALSSWVITVARSRCLDILRKRRGRHREPPWLQQRPRLERTVFRLHYAESMGYAEIRAWLQDRGQRIELADLIAIVERLERDIDPRVRIRYSYDCHARSVGVSSGRLLEFMDALRIEAEQRAEALRPDYELFEAQTRRMLASIHACMERLPEEERRVVDLHFFQGQPASRIAAQLGFPNRRRTYTLVDRALHRLRLMLAPESPTRNGHGRPGSNGKKTLAESKKESE